MKKLISLIAILLLLTLVFASCVDEGKKPIETTAEQSAGTEPQSTTTPITEPATDFDAPEGTLRKQITIGMTCASLEKIVAEFIDNHLTSYKFFIDNDNKIVMVLFDLDANNLIMSDDTCIKQIKVFERRETPLKDEDADNLIKDGMTLEKLIEVTGMIPYTLPRVSALNLYVFSETKAYYFRVKTVNDEQVVSNVSVQELSQKVVDIEYIPKGMTYSQLCLVMGSPGVDIGSGVSLYQWELENGKYLRVWFVHPQSDENLVYPDNLISVHSEIFDPDK